MTGVFDVIVLSSWIFQIFELQWSIQAKEEGENGEKLFAAAFAICGGANPKIAERISDTSWWIFHGEEDNVVPAKYSQQMYDALIEEDADVKLTMYPDVNHDSWTNAFAEPELLKWLFSKSL